MRLFPARFSPEFHKKTAKNCTTTVCRRARILFASEQYSPWGAEGRKRRGKGLGGWISLLFHKLRKRVNAEVQTLGLTGIQSHALHYILVKSEEGPVYQRDVEGVFGVSRSTVTGMLQQMERDGLIRRDSVEGDGRLKCLIPTQKAIEMDERVRECLRRVDERLTQGLTPSQLAAFREVAAQMAANLDE